MFKIDVLASSSAGNCYIVSYGDKHFMIECGIPIRDISKKILKLGLNFNDISFCLISHKHNDHSREIKPIARSGVKLIGPEEVVSQFRGATIAKPKEILEVKGCRIIPFEVNHGECHCLGYAIEHQGDWLMFATDCRLIEADLSKYPIQQMMIECNYLDEKVGVDSYRERRQINTHMSLEGCIKHIQKFKSSSLKEVYLLHMSAAYGDTLISKARVEQEVGKDVVVYVAQERGGVC